MTETYNEEYRVTIERDLATDKIVAEYWRNDKGELSKGNQPAIVRYDLDTGRIVRCESWNDGKLNHDFGPAIQVFHPISGKPHEQHFYRDGLRHNGSGEPAVLISLENGSCSRVEYWVDGNRHRSSGPAIIEFDPDTNDVISEQYFQRGLALNKGSPPRKFEP